jgi:hypothetical protein
MTRISKPMTTLGRLVHITQTQHSPAGVIEYHLKLSLQNQRQMVLQITLTPCCCSVYCRYIKQVLLGVLEEKLFYIGLKLILPIFSQACNYKRKSSFSVHSVSNTFVRFFSRYCKPKIITCSKNFLALENLLKDPQKFSQTFFP